MRTFPLSNKKSNYWKKRKIIISKIKREMKITILLGVCVCGVGGGWGWEVGGGGWVYVENV